MRFELYPPEQSKNSNIDFVLVDEALAIMRDGFNDTMYPEVIRLACQKRGYKQFIGLVILAIQLAKEELGQSPQGILQVNWVGNWRVLVAGQTVNVMEFDTDENGQRSDESPANKIVFYNRFQWTPKDAKIRIVDTQGHDIKSEAENGESNHTGENIKDTPQTSNQSPATMSGGLQGRFDLFLNGRKIVWRTIQITDDWDSETKTTRRTMEVIE